MKKVYLKGPILTQSGYGHHARTVYKALRSRPDLFDVYIEPISWGQTSWLTEDDEERKEIDQHLKKTIEYINSNGAFDMSIQVTIPNEWDKIAPINIGVTAGIETTLISPQWIEKSRLMNKVITISNHSAEIFKNTSYRAKNNHTGLEQEVRCSTPVEYVSYPVINTTIEKLDLDLETKFNFLTVGQLSPRKNMGHLVKCFIEKFKDNEDVGLVIKATTAKTSLIDRKHTLNVFKSLVGDKKDIKCKVYLLHGYLTKEEMAGLYTHPNIKALVSTTHGEGFGLPLFEAAALGLPIAATDWSGHLDFLYMPKKQKNGKFKNKHMFNRISYTLRPIEEEAVWDGILLKESMWAFPEEGSTKMAMEELYKDHGRFKKRAKDLQMWIQEEFTEKKHNEKFVNFLKDFMMDEEENPLAYFELENE
jgi:glycosyltransferase involved in cell wall biosynthesis